VGGRLHASATLTQGNSPGNNYMGGWWKLGVHLEKYDRRKSVPPPEFDTQTVKPVVVSSYSDYAFAPQILLPSLLK